MKKYIIIILLFVTAGFCACIDDQSRLADGVISEISIQSLGNDTVYSLYGYDLVIDGRELASQTMDQELHFEWRATKVTYDPLTGPKEDSLKYISFEPVLKYTFPELGEYRAQLRVSNNDMSKLYGFRVYVTTQYWQGLFVLSGQEEKEGRTAFLYVPKEEDIVTAKTEDFYLTPLENINKEVAFRDVTDAVTIGSNLYVLSRADQKVYLFDNSTFDLIYTYDARQDIPWMKPGKLAGSTVTGGDMAYLLSDNGDMAMLDMNNFYMIEDKTILPEQAHYTLVYSGRYMVDGILEYFLLDREASRVDYFIEMPGMALGTNSGELFNDYEIVNMFRVDDGTLCTVLKDRQHANSIKISLNMASVVGAVYFMEAIGKEFELEQLNLTPESQMLYVPLQNNIFYNNGRNLYRWIWRSDINDLPTETDATMDGEITCMAVSGDSKYLYLGIWNPDAPEELKGSVYVYDIATRTVINQFRGIADKPVKIFFKEKSSGL